MFVATCAAAPLLLRPAAPLSLLCPGLCLELSLSISPWYSAEPTGTHGAYGSIRCASLSLSLSLSFSLSLSLSHSLRLPPSLPPYLSVSLSLLCISLLLCQRFLAWLRFEARLFLRLSASWTLSLEKMLKTAAVLSTDADARFWEVGDQERSHTSETCDRRTPEYSQLRQPSTKIIPQRRTPMNADSPFTTGYGSSSRRGGSRSLPNYDCTLHSCWEPRQQHTVRNLSPYVLAWTHQWTHQAWTHQLPTASCKHIARR